MAFSTTNDYYKIRWAGGNDLCAEKGLAVYTRSQAIYPDGEKDTVVLIDLSSGKEKELTDGKNPKFSPDGREILLTRNGQLYLYAIEDGKERKLTSMRFGVEKAVWSPKGDRIAFLSKVELACAPSLWNKEETPGEKEEAARRKARHPYVSFEDYGYKSDEDGGFSVGRCTTLWSVEVKGGAPILLTDGEREHVMPVFTPDGETVLFVSNRDYPRSESIAMDLFAVPAAGGEIRKLTKDCWIAYYPASFQPLVTPDGSSVVFGALAPSLAGGMPLTRLFKTSLTPGEDGHLPEADALWPENAPCHEATCFFYNCENPGGDRPSAALSEDGKYLYFVSGWHGASNLYRASTDKAEIVPVTSELAAWRSVVRSNDQYLLTRGDFISVPELYLADEGMMRGEKPFEPKKLTDLNPWMKGMLVSPKEMWIDTLDGESRVQGFVFPPQGIEPGKKYPAVVYIHGGPTPFMGAALTYEHQCILGAGMGLIIMNFRGSSGYGEAHQSMKRAYDGGAMTDILQFVDAAVKENSWIDGERIGVTGGSFGGYMTNWICGHSRRFKAAVTQRSIANELIQYASSDMAGSSKEYQDFSDFIMDKLKESPVSYAEKIDIPFLILHGMNDMRCPVEHAHQLFSALKETHPDNPVEMILFPGMTHSFPMGGPMDLRIAHYDAMIEWFKKYL